MNINFNNIGSFRGTNGGANVISNPTSLQFGPDGRLYVSEQNGTINAFALAIQNGEYIATTHEELLLSNGSEVVKSIQNHNDDGSLSSNSKRQVTGILVAGTATNPILYISSSDPRISTNGDANLDTNSGVVTRVTWTGSEWDAVDILRGLPRSEENHANNGMVLSADETKLYLTVGGNTNNGAPSQFFSYTGEYALSGTVLEIDLIDLNSRPILIDPTGGQNGQPRQYIYDLPTLDDPSVANDGVREDANGLDVAGPWGGNDGFNMAILPSDAPLRIYADGFRNHYDLVLTDAGNLYTVDNGSNGGLGGNPILDGNGEATNQPNSGGSGDSEPLFLIEDGGYYSHPNPARSNQDLAWIVSDDSGNPDSNVTPNSIPNLSDLVPAGVNIQTGFIIDPSKFTSDSNRLAESGIRIENDSPLSTSLVNIGSSSNGLVEYTANAFGGDLKGDLLVAQFNGNIGRLDLSADGTTATYETINGLSGLSLPLDVTTGPDGSVWVAEFGGDSISVFLPSDIVLPNNPDSDNDGILNINDPFIRDSSNGTSVTLLPGQTLLWDFDANQDNNRPGPDGYGGGLTGVMIDGITDFDEFFQEPSNLPDQNIKLDNVKFITAAGGGTTVIENVSNGDPSTTSNNGEYLFHTGVTISPIVEAFTIKWSLFNPGDALTGSLQQLGGYIGTGDQSNFLKVVAIQSPSGEIEVSLEDSDVIQSNAFIQANDLFNVEATDSKQIFIELTVDPIAETATPMITYETASGNTTVNGNPVSLTGTAVLDAIKGDYTVAGQSTGLAVGLLSSNNGQPPANTFQSIFGDIEITAANTSSTVLYRVNAGGGTIAAIDGGPDWSTDTKSNPSPFLLPGTKKTSSFSAVDPGGAVPTTTPGTIFDTERWDPLSGAEMQWAFNTPTSGLYEVRLYLGNGFSGTSASGQRVFDVAIEGNVLNNLNDIDLSGQFGHQVGSMISNVVEVTDGTLNIDFLHGVENPLVNGIEIIQVDDGPPINTPPTITTPALVSVAENQTAILDINATDDVDSEGSGLTYSLSGGPDISLFSVDATGGLTFLSAPDFENAGDANSDNVYEVDVTVTDSGNLSTSQTLNITVSDVVELGSVVSITAPSPNSIQETGDIGITTLSFPVTFDTPPSSEVTVEYSVEINGVLTTGLTQELGTVDGTIAIDIPNDDIANGPETVNVTLTGIPVGGELTNLGNTTATAIITEDESLQQIGEAVLTVTVNSNNVQISNFGSNSFQLTNTGEKTIESVVIDVTNALYSDSVFDPFGLAGDTVAKALQINTSGDTGIIAPNNDPTDPNNQTYLGEGGIAGYEAIQLFFDENNSNGFEPGETLGFSVDMDPNSIAGAEKNPLDAGSSPSWDVGGVSGAELIGSTFAVTFTDGTTATGQLQGNNNQGGSKGLATQSPENLTVALTVNGLSAGSTGTYNANGPSVIVNGPAGETARIVLTKGFIQPITNNFTGAFAAQLDQQLTDLAASGFPANNAVEFQTVDVLLTGINQDISGQFDFSGVSSYNFAGEDQLPLGFVASVIDPINDNLSLGPVTQPIYLQFDTVPGIPVVSIVNGSQTISENEGQIQISLTTDVTVPSNETVDISFEIVPETATPGTNGDYDYVSNSAAFDPQTGVYTDTVTIAGSSSDVTIPIDILQDSLQETNESFIVNITDVSSNATIGSSLSATITITDDDASSPVLYRVNAGGGTIAAIDGGPDWSTDTKSNPSPFFLSGTNKTSSFSAVDPGGSVPATTPGTIFDTERWEPSGGAEMQWAFNTPAPGFYEVRLYLGNGFNGTSASGQRVFDVAIEGDILNNFNDIDLSGQFGHQVGGMISNVVEVTDGILNIDFFHEIENPLVNGIEIIQLGSTASAMNMNNSMIDNGDNLLGMNLDNLIPGNN